MSDDKLTDFYSAVDALIDYAHTHLKLDPTDSDWARNQIFALFGLNSYRPTGATGSDHERPDAILEQLRETGIAAGLFDESQAESLCDQMMGIVSLSPSAMKRVFLTDVETHGGSQAMANLYDYSIKNNYVRRSVLDQNPRFETNGLIITINKAKPEFKSAAKAQAGNSVAGGYPKCSICHENEGFAGRTKFTLRTVPLTLDGQSWFWQFSPYGYLYEHGIAVNYEHTPMHVDRGTFRRLMDFVDQFPDLFIGSNAALPRIGGSVLGHDHYQAGGEKLPMHVAGSWKTFIAADFPQARIEILDWHNTAVRVVSTDREAIEELSARIHEAWINYHNEELGIIPRDGDDVFSAVSPTVLLTERGYEMSIILRSNITSEEYPEGVFHAHPEFFAIKQESIGLIEAQGLFILPGRLDTQLDQLAQLLQEDRELPEELSEFAGVFAELRELIGDSRDADVIAQAIRDELGSVCQRILENTAVFKDHRITQGFLEGLGFTPEN
ncbi:galactose-1-phosphate uridylyltransferase [Arcanobacterium pinnipediorum]|uniref:Galactose-1-phosphate uridylyltransferase n=1 Tax=Arcanobacterium pinnipediorum TaxID=1503041 RepID=A0ABY5AJC9_9ACTO|nr:galactose-1-phosphate uridylyltransferase [Arcanobacterium pinnipediorum]USR79349.1 galactose-1-phosphate uridylyltransferase [Arcanobacterium pinnipediorum]